MKLIVPLKVFIVGSLLFTLPVFSSSDEATQKSSSLPCPYPVYARENSKFGTITYIQDSKVKNIEIGYRWICYNGQVFAETRKRTGGQMSSDIEENYGFNKSEDGNEYYYPRVGGKLVRKDRILLRMVKQEEYYGDKNGYWLMDFRETEPLLIGPIPVLEGTQLTDGYSVIWNDDNAIIIFDDDGAPSPQPGASRGGHDPYWPKGERKFVKDVTVLGVDLEEWPLMNTDGVFHPRKRGLVNMYTDVIMRKGKLIAASDKRGSTPVKNERYIYPAYHYDYKTKKLKMVAIEDDYLK